MSEAGTQPVSMPLYMRERDPLEQAHLYHQHDVHSARQRDASSSSCYRIEWEEEREEKDPNPTNSIPKVKPRRKAQRVAYRRQATQARVDKARIEDVNPTQPMEETRLPRNLHQIARPSDSTKAWSVNPNKNPKKPHSKDGGQSKNK
jgi:hypothetical protein